MATQEASEPQKPTEKSELVSETDAKNNQNPPSDSQATSEKAQSEDTKTDVKKADPRGKPWVDFLPNPTIRPLAKDLHGRLIDYLSDLNHLFEEKENYKITGSLKKLHPSYTNMWQEDANVLFRCIVGLRRRIKLAQTSNEENNKTSSV